MLYCVIDDLKSYLLEEYRAAVEAKDSGASDRHIAQYSSEIQMALKSGGYELDKTSAILTRICAVKSCYAIVGQLTTLVQDANATKNKWIPLQQQVAKADEDLEKIAAGKLDPFILDREDDEGGRIAVDSSDRIFTDEVLRYF